MLRILLFLRLIIEILALTKLDSLPTNDDEWKDSKESYYYDVKD